MTRFASITALALSYALTANAFTVSNMSRQRMTGLKMSEEEEAQYNSVPTVERGVSLDQDGKSNVWAIEPKIEVEAKSSEEKTSSLIFAGAGLGVFGALAAGVLSNLPDPNQF
jgi:hypothetical protein